MEEINEIFELTHEQQKAFKGLKKAYQNCLKTGLKFYNNYGTVGVYDKNKILSYNDIDSGIKDIGQNSYNEFKHPAGDSWADDTHYFHPKK